MEYVTFKCTFKLCFLQLPSLDFNPAEFLRETLSEHWHWNSKCILLLYPQATGNSDVFVRFRSLGCTGGFWKDQLNRPQKIPWAENSCGLEEFLFPLWLLMVPGGYPLPGQQDLWYQSYHSCSSGCNTTPGQQQSSARRHSVGEYLLEWVYGMTNYNKEKPVS